MLLVNHLHIRQHVGVEIGERLLGERLTVDDNPFTHARQVRAGVASDPQLPFPEQAIDHPRGGGLAVGTGHMDDPVVVLGVAEQVHGRAHAV